MTVLTSTPSAPGELVFWDCVGAPDDLYPGNNQILCSSATVSRCEEKEGVLSVRAEGRHPVGRAEVCGGP